MAFRVVGFGYCTVRVWTVEWFSAVGTGWRIQETTASTNRVGPSMHLVNRPERSGTSEGLLGDLEVVVWAVPSSLSQEIPGQTSKALQTGQLFRFWCRDSGQRE
eukprot:s114_g1.t1